MFVCLCNVFIKVKYIQWITTMTSNKILVTHSNLLGLQVTNTRCITTLLSYNQNKCPANSAGTANWYYKVWYCTSQCFSESKYTFVRVVVCIMYTNGWGGRSSHTAVMSVIGYIHPLVDAASLTAVFDLCITLHIFLCQLIRKFNTRASFIFNGSSYFT